MLPSGNAIHPTADMGGSVRIGALFVAFAIGLSAASAASAAQTLRVSTIAGSGQAGYKDGPATSAQFLFPTAIAADDDGNIYVADTAAQRIRIIARDGIVRTLAGSGNASQYGIWVPAGYRDGAGKQAQFNAPSGLAVTHDAIFVSDSYSACIRRIARDGTVSTFAGTPFKEGKTDGARTSALFSHPLGMAADSHGNIFVADVDAGVRKIDAAGMVTTEPLQTDHPLSVAVYENGHDETLFVADALGILVRLPNGKSKRITAPTVVPTAYNGVSRRVEGDLPIGYPVALSAVDDHSVVYTDSRTHTVRFLDTNTSYSRVLGGQATDSAPQTSGGFRDGAAPQSLFDAPLGVLFYRGEVLVADSGNKRIRRISGLDLRRPTVVSTALPACSSKAQTFQIALVGNSLIWWDTDWDSSIPGQLEDALNAGNRGSQQRVEVTPIQLFAAELDKVAGYIDVLATLRCYQAVVFAVNAGSLGTSLGTDPQAWEAPATRLLREIGRTYRQAGIPLILVAVPTPLEIGPSESTWVKVPQAALTPWDWGGAWHRVLNNSGVDYVDMWPPFAADIKSPQHQALYGTVDSHLTAHGRSLVASLLAEHLRKIVHRSPLR
jgi:hypothetical protein